MNLLLMALMDNRLVFLMNDFLMFFMNDGLMLFVYDILVDHCLMMLMDHILMMLMDDVLMFFLNDILMMFMNNFFVMFFDDGCRCVLLDYCSFSMVFHEGVSNRFLYNGTFGVSNDGRLCLSGGLHNSSSIESCSKWSSSISY